ncbi:unnamed protein product [Periconia digitata]|uniref:Uncharacterized protein n=1 Tax=Periconia digitata TaxID=1303443 RepID=A0A9W4UES9_9PLEO|nr:unnamed protein product [Periconia digitata]
MYPKCKLGRAKRRVIVQRNTLPSSSSSSSSSSPTYDPRGPNKQRCRSNTCNLSRALLFTRENGMPRDYRCVPANGGYGYGYTNVARAWASSIVTMHILLLALSPSALFVFKPLTGILRGDLRGWADRT